MQYNLCGMCLAVPGIIQSIEGEMARISVQGVIINASLALVPEAEIGDFVLVHTGYAIQRLSTEEAKETLQLLSELEASWTKENLH